MSLLVKMVVFVVLGFAVCDKNLANETSSTINTNDTNGTDETNETNDANETAVNANASSILFTHGIKSLKALKHNIRSTGLQILMDAGVLPSFVGNNVAEKTGLEDQAAVGISAAAIPRSLVEGNVANKTVTEHSMLASLGITAASPPLSLVENSVAENADLEKQEAVGTAAAGPPASLVEAENRGAAGIAIASFSDTARNSTNGAAFADRANSARRWIPVKDGSYDGERLQSLLYIGEGTGPSFLKCYIEWESSAKWPFIPDSLSSPGKWNIDPPFKGYYYQAVAFGGGAPSFIEADHLFPFEDSCEIAGVRLRYDDGEMKPQDEQMEQFVETLSHQRMYYEASGL